VTEVPDVALLIRATIGRVARMSASDMRVTEVRDVALLIRATLQHVARMSVSDMRGHDEQQF